MKNGRESPPLRSRRRSKTEQAGSPTDRPFFSCALSQRHRHGLRRIFHYSRIVEDPTAALSRFARREPDYGIMSAFARRGPVMLPSTASSGLHAALPTLNLAPGEEIESTSPLRHVSAVDDRLPHDVPEQWCQPIDGRNPGSRACRAACPLADVYADFTWQVKIA